jgi:hypothetical protein
MLLDTYTSSPTFPSDSAPLIASHPLIISLIRSLLLDGSSTLCTIGLSVLVKLMPVFAIKACECLRKVLPLMLAVLARVICWKGSAPTVNKELDEPPAETDQIREIPPLICEDLHWNLLEHSFETTSSAPSAQKYFAFLYFLYPCNVIRFLRKPVQYLNEREIPCPWAVGWYDVLDEDNLRSRSEVSHWFFL